MAPVATWRARSLPRFIDPLSIEDGDTIKVAWKAGGIEYTKTATVYRRITTHTMTEYFTAEGTEIFHFIPGQDRKIRVTLLAVAKPADVTPLSTLEELEEMLK